MIDFRSLVKAGVHFGHQTSRWCPKMAPYIWGVKNDAHLIDVSKTAYCLDQASKFLEGVAAQGKTILWVGTKKAAQQAIHAVASKLDAPYVNHRWIGGTLSNFPQVKKSITKMLHLEDVIAKSDQYSYYTKKEFNTFSKQVNRLGKNVGGIRSIAWPVGAIVLVDIIKEQSALKEAVVMGIPVVAMVDTNADPSLVDYVIPANDDAPRSINLIIDTLAQAVEKGKKKAAAEAKKKKEEAVAAKSAKDAADKKDKAVVKAAADSAKKEEKPKAATVKKAAKPAAKSEAKAAPQKSKESATSKKA